MSDGGGAWETNMHDHVTLSEATGHVEHDPLHLVQGDKRLRASRNGPYHISRVSRPVLVFCRLGW